MEGGEGEEMMSGDGEVDDNDETIGSGGDDNVRLEVNEEEEERKEKKMSALDVMFTIDMMLYYIYQINSIKQLIIIVL